MAYTLDLNKLLSDIRGPKGVAAVTEEINKLKGELERIRRVVEPKVEQKLKQTQTRLNDLKKTVESRQKAWERDFKKTVQQVKKKAQKAEDRFESALKKAKSTGSTAKKATKAKATSKKAAPKARKTSKKA